MDVVTRRPSAELAPFVSSFAYYQGEFGHARERIIPTGTMQLLVNLHEDEFRRYDPTSAATVHRTPGAVVQGAHGAPTVIDPRGQRAVVVIGFRPAGAAPFFAAPAAALTDSLVGLEDLWGHEGAVLHERMCEAGTPEAALEVLEGVLLDRAVRPLVPDPGVHAAVRSLDRGVPVAVVADHLGTTPKRLARRFGDQIGLTPKRFARVRRFQRVLASIRPDRPVDWADLAGRTGYFDQSHLIHEFQELAGSSPTAYRPRSMSERNHVPL